MSRDGAPIREETGPFASPADPWQTAQYVELQEATPVAKVLMNHGFTRVRPLYGGLDAWIAAGYSFETLRLETDSSLN